MAKLRVFYNEQSNMLITVGEKTAVVTYRRTSTPYADGMAYFDEMAKIEDSTQKSVEVYPPEKKEPELPLKDDPNKKTDDSATDWAKQDDQT